MANQPPNSSRSSAAAFTDVADIGAALVALTGFPAGTLGFQGAGDGYRAFRPGDRLVAKGPTATSEYVVQENLAGTDVVAVQTYPSAAGSSLPDIVYVTARPAKYPGLSSAVYATLAAGEAALPVTGGTLILLDDDYVLTAPLVLRDNMRLFSYSSTGTLITNGTAGATIETEGNAEFTNIRFDNGVGEPAIRLLALGTITLNHCALGAGAAPIAIDAATNDVGLTLSLLNTKIKASIVGGATAAAFLSGQQSDMAAVTFGLGGGPMSLRGCGHGSLDTPGMVTLEECIGLSASIGAFQVPVRIRAVNCRLSGGTVVNAGEFNARNLRMIGLYAVTIGGAVLLQQSDLEDLTTLNATGDVTAVGSSISGALVTLGMLIGTRSSFAAVDAVAISTERCSFGGIVKSSSTFDDTGSDIATGFAVIVDTQLDWTFTKCLSQITVRAQSEFNACHIHVGTAVAGGAIVSIAGTVNLRGGTYVRADDTLFNVSGTGTVSAQGSISGGCRFDTSTGLVVGQTVSDVRGNSVLGPTNLPPGPSTTLTFLGGGTNTLHDTFLLLGGPTNVDVYDAAYVPNGFDVIVANYGGINTFTMTPPVGNTFNNGAIANAPMLPGQSAKFRRVSSTDWLVLRY